MRQRSLIPIVAGGSLFIGAIIYSRRPEAPKSAEQNRRDAADAKRAELGSGASVGGNFTTGGHELSSKTDRPSEKAQVPKEKLPSGGVGGGVGAGGSNVRSSIEMRPYEVAGTSSSKAGVSGALQGLFGTGGARAQESSEPDTKNTKVASHYEYTPTKRGNETGQHDMRQPRVPRPNTPGGYDHKDAGPNA